MMRERWPSSRAIPCPKLVHGAGGIAYHDGKFIVVGGLPDEVDENYLYEYDASFKFLRRHVLASGHTQLGIQTVAWADGSWWFGCYGTPKCCCVPMLRSSSRAVGVRRLLSASCRWQTESFSSARTRPPKARENEGRWSARTRMPQKGWFWSRPAAKAK